MRPGGLTALAVFNFIFGGLGLIGSLISLATVELSLKMMREQAKFTGDTVPSAGAMYGLLAMSAISGGLLITSGVGYLGLRRVVGRIVGNVYALWALVTLVTEIMVFPGQFSIFSLVGFVYPLITLFLLNLIFRKDFTR